MNLSDLQGECGRLLNDPNNQRWSGETIRIRLNLAQIAVQGYTNAEKTSESLTPTANNAVVSLNSSVMDILKVYYTQPDGNVFPLDGYTTEQLDYVYPNWKNWTAGQPKAYWYDATSNTINLVPAPDATYALTNALTVWEARKPADLSAPADIPFDSTNTLTPYHLALVHWTVAQCWMDDATPESLAKSKFHKSGLMNNPGEFEKQIMRINSKFDSPEDIPSQIMFRQQGGRLGTWGPSKAYPLA